MLFDRSLYIDKQSNEICYYPVTIEKQDVVLYAKCDIGREDIYRNRMLGGVFEGSNHPDFLEKDTLFIIQSKPERLSTTVKVGLIRSTVILDILVRLKGLVMFRKSLFMRRMTQ